MIENNYEITLEKKNKFFSVNCKHDIITINNNGVIQNIIDIENETKDIIWISCLNLLRKKWMIKKAIHIPDFDISYFPLIYENKYKKNIIQSCPCILIENKETFYYDNISKCVWENNNTLVHFPKSILNYFFQIDFVVEFFLSNNIVTLIPKTIEEYNKLLAIPLIEISPFYNNFDTAFISIQCYKYMWKTIRFLNHHDCIIDDVLHL